MRQACGRYTTKTKRRSAKLLVRCQRQSNVVSVSLIDSSDTTEHVASVVGNRRFFEQFRGWQWGQDQKQLRIDGVSGATLTSLALAEGVIVRMGGRRPSLVFPDELTLDELAKWVKGDLSIDAQSGHVMVRSEAGEPAGRVIRTGPLSDDVAGYQGPTELLVWIGGDEKIVDLRIRGSFDNEPYVDYVRTERSFWKRFKGKSLEELAVFDPVAAGVEGVSGATMTSLAVANMLVAAAKAALAKSTEVEVPEPNAFAAIRWSQRDLVTIAVLIACFLVVRTRLLRDRRWRQLWLAFVFTTIGLWTGNLVSLALVAGWSAEGIAWQLAPALFAVAAVALLSPPTTKGNPYCNHLCPHGAMQQLIKPPSQSRRHLKLPPIATKWLTQVPGVTLTIAYVALILVPSTDLSSWEPFHAYLFTIAGWGSIGLAVGTLAFAAFVPMGYCRMGCPTGRLLEYLRRSSNSNRISRADYVAIALMMIAGTRYWLNP